MTSKASHHFRLYGTKYNQDVNPRSTTKAQLFATLQYRNT